MDWSTSLMGLAIGFLVGMTGVGGASLLTPILILLGYHPSIAVGTDLFYNAITKCFGIMQHHRQKTIDYKVIKWLAAGSIPGAVLSICLLQLYAPFFHSRDLVIKHALGFILVVVALTTIIRQFYDRTGKEKQAENTEPKTKKRNVQIVALGFVLGFIVGLTSIGSGSLFAIALIYWLKLKPSKVVGTDIAHAFLLVTAAGLLQAGFGNVDYALAGKLLIGSVPGVILGSAMSAKVPSRPLRTVMAALILISGIKLI